MRLDERMIYRMMPIIILLALVACCQSAEPVKIDRENSMSILESFNINLANQSQNETIQPNNSSNKATGTLWNWGAAPQGYVVDPSGNLVSLTNQEWTPSI